MHHINQLPLINLQSASVCSLKDKELEGKFLLLSFTVCDCGSISTNFKTAALLLFFRNLLCLKKGWFPTLHQPGRCSREGTAGEMGQSSWWRGWKTLLKGTQLATGALFPPFQHQEKFNPMTFCSQSCMAVLEAIDILIWMRRDKEQPRV